MKEADAAQASNLGQALVPAIAGRFQELTQRRYETVHLTAQLATEGIVVSGALRPKNQISVGTREQLSTLYRLSLAEYLSTAIVMDGSRCIISRTSTQSPTLIVNAAPGKRLCPSFSPTHPIGPSGHPRRPEARGRLLASQSQTFL